eukprot:SAG31_NODE_1264_length_9071_cov_17.828132_1_plen_60_part_00
MGLSLLNLVSGGNFSEEGAVVGSEIGRGRTLNCLVHCAVYVPTQQAYAAAGGTSDPKRV